MFINIFNFLKRTIKNKTFQVFIFILIILILVYASIIIGINNISDNNARISHKLDSLEIIYDDINRDAENKMVEEVKTAWLDLLNREFPDSLKIK